MTGAHAPSAASGAKTPERAALIQRAFRLEWLTLAWMAIEAAVATASGVAAGSLALTAFGLDSVIELISAALLIWRLEYELRRGEAFSGRAERLASRGGAGLLFALSACIVLGAAWKFRTHHRAQFSLPGLLLAAIAIPAMAALARRKLEVARRLASPAMRADAIESLTCGWLSLVVVVGLIANWLIAAWWVDPVTSLGVVWLLVKEAREAWAGGPCCAVHFAPPGR